MRKHKDKRGSSYYILNKTENSVIILYEHKHCLFIREGNKLGGNLRTYSDHYVISFKNKEIRLFKKLPNKKIINVTNKAGSELNVYLRKILPRQTSTKNRFISIAKMNSIARIVFKKARKHRVRNIPKKLNCTKISPAGIILMSAYPGIDPSSLFYKGNRAVINEPRSNSGLYRNPCVETFINSKIKKQSGDLINYVNERKSKGHEKYVSSFLKVYATRNLVPSSFVKKSSFYIPGFNRIKIYRRFLKQFSEENRLLLLNSDSHLLMQCFLAWLKNDKCFIPDIFCQPRKLYNYLTDEKVRKSYHVDNFHNELNRLVG